LGFKGLRNEEIFATFFLQFLHFFDFELTNFVPSLKVQARLLEMHLKDKLQKYSYKQLKRAFSTTEANAE
jgi:hypothetical protein